MKVRSVLKIAFTLPWVLSAPLAFAHAHLEKEIPMADSVMDQSPTSLQLFFSEGIEPAFSKITLQGPNHQVISTGALKVLNDKATEVALPIKEKLSAGQYRVVWKVVSVDTHKSEGDYQFSVK